MATTNHAIGEQINLAQELNKKLESPVLQAEMGLDAQATATKQAVRWDEFSVKHNNDGTFKGIDQSDLNLTSSATATKKPVRWDEFSVKHNNDGSFKTGVITSADIQDGTIKDAEISSSAAIQSSKLAIQKLYKKSASVNPSATANTYGTQVDLTPATGYLSTIPCAFDVVFGGTFGTETVSTDVVVTYSDATTATVTKTASATGTVSFTNSDVMSLIKDNVYINKISIKSKSTIASTTSTVVVNHFGFYL